jgi:hypothetical protein
MDDPRAQLGTALDRLESILDTEPDDVGQDAALHRFQVCFELCWNSARRRLQELDVDCASPDGCVQAASRQGWIDADAWSELIAARNQLPASGDPEIAASIYRRLPEFAERMRELESILSS